MAVCYDKQFQMKIDKKVTNAQLMECASFNASIITRLKKD